MFKASVRLSACLALQAQVMAYWQHSHTDSCVEAGSEAHPILQDVSLFVTMMDCGGDIGAFSPQTYLHVSVHPLVTILVTPDHLRTLKFAADAVLSHVVRLLLLQWMPIQVDSLQHAEGKQNFIAYGSLVQTMLCAGIGAPGVR